MNVYTNWESPKEILSLEEVLEYNNSARTIRSTNEKLEKIIIHENSKNVNEKYSNLNNEDNSVWFLHYELNYAEQKQNYFKSAFELKLKCMMYCDQEVSEKIKTLMHEDSKFDNRDYPLFYYLMIYYRNYYNNTKSRIYFHAGEESVQDAYEFFMENISEPDFTNDKEN